MSALFSTISIFLVPQSASSQLFKHPSIHAALQPYLHDPEEALLKACAGSLVVLCWTGSTELARRERARSETDKLKHKLEGKGWWFHKGKPLFNTIFYTLYLSLLLHVAIILLGAPLTGSKARTYLLSLLLSLLAFPAPLLSSPLALPTSSPAILLKDPMLPLFIILNGKLGAHRMRTLLPLIGAWVSRPWQQWPVPLVVGAWMGHVVGSLTDLLVAI
ncbi:hypothetical protein BT69DRAFT_1283753 [Atractiella rhizophila]|nr:hypothetical protein BT69DRAFT_1283753 [Atractiella rhizophila]